MWDLIIRGGLVFDGGNPKREDADGGEPGRVVAHHGRRMREADVVIRDGVICGVGRFGGELAREEIDARGLVVSPGFIDIHSHADGTILANPLAESKVRQGITTEVVGNCGSSPAPLKGEAREACQKSFGVWGVEVAWGSLGEYLDLIERLGCSVNVAVLVGHGTVRLGALGYEAREADLAELSVMKELVREAMADGAFGLSSGLAYTPGCFASTEEVAELAKVVGPYGGIYATHLRSEGDSLLEAVEEALDVARSAGVRLQVSHHKAAGRRNWGKTAASLARLDEASLRGLSVGLDAYPYTAASTSLSSLLPRWALHGGTRAMLERLKDPSVRRRIVLELNEEEGVKSSYGWENVRISRTNSGRNDFTHGMSIAEFADLSHRDPAEAALDLLLEEDGSVAVVIFGMEEDEVKQVLRHPLCAIGSDASAWAAYGVLGRGRPHPRGYGAFPRVLRRYVREEGLLSLEEALWKMTGWPAQILGLTDRGRISPGYWGDVTIFDPSRVCDTATYDRPHSYPEGIEYVIVNGVITVRDGEHLGTLVGRPLRRGTGLFRTAKKLII